MRGFGGEAVRKRPRAGRNLLREAIVRSRQRPPARNHPGTIQGSGIVDNARKQPAHLNGSGELAALIESGADRGGLVLGNAEHPRMMAVRPTASKRDVRPR